MTRLVVLADTHMPRRGRELPGPLLEALNGADMIVHLGDFTEASVADFLQSIAPLEAVFGNNDSLEIQQRFPSECEVHVTGHRLVLVHGHLSGPTAVASARKVRDADAVLFGHSHASYSSYQNGTLLFNPGSPTDRRFSPSRSFGILDISDVIEAHIIPLR